MNSSVKNSYDGLVKSRFCPFLSFPRRRESSYFNRFWIPAFTGMTVFRLFTTSSVMGGNNRSAVFLPRTDLQRELQLQFQNTAVLQGAKDTISALSCLDK
ncbi:hypothetical protein DS62_12750 [Smithella sp. SC_K08D17]|nr:hypothetical protein DS62_12750 [Smithella sp. SC_K08D17]